MSSYQAVKISQKKQWEDFYHLPNAIYQSDPIQTMELRAQIEEELNPRKNPIAADCEYQAFLVYKNNQVAARAVAMVNPLLNKSMEQSIGLLGYIEFIEDNIALKLLLETCSYWLEKQACDVIWTDTRFSLNYQVGIQTQGFDQPHTFLMPRQPLYYSSMLSSLGFTTAKNLHAYHIDLNDTYEISKEITFQAKQLQTTGYKIRCMKKSDVWACLRHYNKRWSNNFAHTSFSEKELKHLNQSMSLFLDTRFCFLIEKDGDLAGYVFTFPDYNELIKSWKGTATPMNLLKFIWRYKIRRKVTTLKTAIIGVDEKHTGKKLSSLLNMYLLKQAKKSGCQHIERSWILEDNIASIKQAKRMGGTLYKQYAIFQAPLKSMKNFDFRRAS